MKESGGDESGGEEDGGGFSLLDDWDVDFVPTVDDDEEALIPEDEEVEKEVKTFKLFFFEKLNFSKQKRKKKRNKSKRYPKKN